MLHAVTDTLMEPERPHYMIRGVVHFWVCFSRFIRYSLEYVLLIEIRSFSCLKKILDEMVITLTTALHLLTEDDGGPVLWHQCFKAPAI